MVATLLTKVVGLVREVMLAAILGSKGTMSAFTVAFQIPNVIRTFVADQALVGSIVPVFTKLREEGDEERAWRVASTVVSILLLILIPITAIAMYYAEFFIDLVVYDKFNQMDLAVELFRILIPIVMMMSIGGVVIGILNSYGEFGPPAFALLLWNVVGIVVIVAGYPLTDGKTDRAVLYSFAILIATLTQALMPVPWLRKYGKGYRLTLGRSFKDPAVKLVMVAMAPVMLSLSVMSLNNIVNTYWSSRVPAELLGGVADAGPGLIYRANSIFQLPQGIFSIAVATVFFPMFALYSARDEKQKFAESVGAAVRQIVVLLMPATLFMIVLAEPITRLLFEHGANDAEATRLTALALEGFAVGLIGNGAAQVLMRAFFSIRSPWTPAIVGFFFNLLVHIVLAGILHEQYGLRGVTIAMGIGNTTVFLALWYVLRTRLDKHTDFKPILSAVVIAGLAAGVSVALGWAGWEGVTDLFGDALIAQVLAMMVAVCLTWGLYSGLAYKLRLVNIPQLRAMKRGGKPS
jgi:putative peptidoglycan lipid II flippase